MMMSATIIKIKDVNRPAKEDLDLLNCNAESRQCLLRCE
ncbi:Uncharacterised protein [uncultured archaeon]|nr:Uncharacterised protein [uncultured archaeon]